MSAPLANDLVRLDGVSKIFAPHVGLSGRIAAALGAAARPRAVRAVEDVSLVVRRGEAVGLVGESGCGKSTLGRMISGISTPSAGTVRVGGVPIRVAGTKTATRVQMVFQDPFASLDPRMRIGATLAEGPLAHGLTTRRDATRYVGEWLSRVGLDPGAADRFPHQFSGGQRQRVAIARALAMRPDVLVCDEPVASLDVSIQAQIINLFLQLRRELDLTLVFISHDLGVVRHLCDRVAVMYLGRIVELGDAADVYREPRHPYTRALLDSVPQLVIEDDVTVQFRPIMGELPSPMTPPPGCHFHGRCPLVFDRCRVERPALRPTEGPGRLAACHLAPAG